MSLWLNATPQILGEGCTLLASIDWLNISCAGKKPDNPLPANQRKRIPEGFFWQVTTAPGREHFVVIASPEPLHAFDDAFAHLEAPRVGEPVVLAHDTAQRFRGVAGLVPSTPSTNDTRLSSLFTTPLLGRETVEGLWARQLTLQNPPLGSSRR